MEFKIKYFLKLRFIVSNIKNDIELVIPICGICVEDGN